MNRRAFVGSCCCTTLSACVHAGTPAPVADLDAAGTQLRTAFNRQIDLVRLILLVSPT